MVESLASRCVSGHHRLAPNIISVRHWDRLLGGLLYAVSPRVDWATLLRRSFSVDVLECPKCHGRLRAVKNSYICLRALRVEHSDGG
jgi:hypothetical protein